MPSTIPICRPFREARRVRKRSGGDTEVLCAAGAGNKNPDLRLLHKASSGAFYARDAVWVLPDAAAGLGG
jgi:hypothetical protein